MEEGGGKLPVKLYVTKTCAAETGGRTGRQAAR